jgi:hypothetical protein
VKLEYLLLSTQHFLLNQEKLSCEARTFFSSNQDQFSHVPIIFFLNKRKYPIVKRIFSTKFAKFNFLVRPQYHLFRVRIFFSSKAEPFLFKLEQFSHTTGTFFIQGGTFLPMNQ